MAILTPVICALAGFTTAPAGGRILFTRDAGLPLPAQAFAWRVIETHCNFQRHELEQRSFWAHDVRASTRDGTVVYSIKILSDLAWKKANPPVTLEMVLAADGHRIRLTALRSSFIVCTLPPGEAFDPPGESPSVDVRR